jgi:Ca-activated chloride channel homolog
MSSSLFGGAGTVPCALPASGMLVTRFVHWFILAGLFWTQLAAAGDTARSRSTQQGENAYTISDNVDLVLLDVSVKDPHDGYVTGLSKADFRVSEDGHVCAITEFASVDRPVTVGLVVDNSGSMRFKRREVMLAGLAFAKESNAQDQFFVTNFNDFVRLGLPEGVAFTDKLQELKAALYYGQAMGKTALYDAIAYALQHLELSQFERRSLIIVSDGGDNASKTTLSELMKLIKASRATIYTVGLFDPESQERNPGVLRRLARITGGDFFEPAKLEDIVPVFNAISKDIRNRYTIGYIPDEVHDSRVVRSVKVSASRNGRKLGVHTRTSYTIKPFSELVQPGGR